MSSKPFVRRSAAESLGVDFAPDSANAGRSSDESVPQGYHYRLRPHPPVSMGSEASQQKLFQPDSDDVLVCCRSRVAIEGGREVSAVVAALPGAVSARNTPSVRATITFTPSGGMTRIGGPQHLFLDRISLMDHHGNR